MARLQRAEVPNEKGWPSYVFGNGWSKILRYCPWSGEAGILWRTKFLKLETFIYSDGLYHEEVDPERRWEGRTEVVKVGIQAELPDLLESSGGYIPTCTLLDKIRHGMYSPRERSTGDQIMSIKHMIPADCRDNAIQDAGPVENSLTPMNYDKTSHTYIKVKISNEMSTRRKTTK